MTKLLPLPLLLAALVAATPASAHEMARCNVPMADWQPREAVQAALEGAGLSVVRIKIDDGCYEVDAVDTTGQRLWMRLDPGSLAVLRQGIPHRRHGGGDDDDDDQKSGGRRKHASPD
ncbi:PepSY domain-containing protein [Rhodobacter lacus]|uniref:PepSY domain-containing protein n=1 Tax=Rhodobacter lacus TaxID=1641972 RepID=A0ABW5AAW1_9RHOB